jgi:2-polyprenyl-6-methoxyphenol hydroxylase-like FAD-dependent oxidoreductase
MTPASNPAAEVLVDVLIVGAGPTGLVLALWLARRGVRFRIIEKKTEPDTTSRALAVQDRTLELYRQLGIADAVTGAGRWMSAVNLWVRGRRAAHAAFEGMSADLSLFRFPLVFPQDEHESLLAAELSRAGVTVERGVELLGFESAPGAIHACLRKADGSEETCRAAYIAGCDGARSVVRQSLGIGFPGGTYEHTFYVADVEAAGDVINGEIHVALDRSDFIAVFPLKQEGRARFVGTVRDQAAQQGSDLGWNDVSHKVIENLKVDVRRVNWFSTYRVHHRVAASFRSGRAFLLGDAAHVHSPVGGQGMNTGIGDACNLAWKLDAVLRGGASESILESYELERIAFARRLVASTDRAFTTVTSSGPLARFTRLEIVPAVLPLLFSSRALRRFLFRTVSQININYRHCEFNSGVAGKVSGGDRLPWVRLGDGSDNFAPLSSLDWQAHVYGQAEPGLRGLCTERNLALHQFSWETSMDRAGLARDALYLIRPDGYVAFAAGGAIPETLSAFLDARAIKL